MKISQEKKWGMEYYEKTIEYLNSKSYKFSYEELNIWDLKAVKVAHKHKNKNYYYIFWDKKTYRIDLYFIDSYKEKVEEILKTFKIL